MLFSSFLLASAFLFENATLLVLLPICATVVLLRLGLRLSQLFALFLSLSIVAVPFLLRSNYLAPRLTLSNDNLSSLAYLNGLQSAQASLMEPPFLGVGFQMMGYRVHETNARSLLSLLDQESLTARDGSFVAAKLITEFGVSGIITLFLYLVIVSKGFLSVIREIRAGRISQSHCIYVASFTAVILQLFIRGSGYLSPFACYALLTYWFRPSSSLFTRNTSLQSASSSPTHVFQFPRLMAHKY
jgi:hypothetical protein